MQEFESLIDGEFDLRAMLAEAVDFLESRCFSPVDGPDGGGKDTRLAAVRGKLAQDSGQLVVQLGEAELGVPKA